MRTQNGLCSYSKNGAELTAITKSLNPKEEEFLGYLKFHGIEDFIRSLKMIHDFALYHTDLCFDKEEKSALFDIKILWEGLERLEKS